MGDFLGDALGLAIAPNSATNWSAVTVLGALGFILGFALNYGSVCTVIAMRELVAEKRPARLVALAESAAWATFLYIAIETAPTLQDGWSPLGYLVPAALLFGLGAYVNGACLFGSVGHFGNGDVEFGFAFLAILAVFYVRPWLGLVPDTSPISASPPIGALALPPAVLALLVLRFGVSYRSESNFWRLTVSMAAIGISFSLLAAFSPRFSITASIGAIVSIPLLGMLLSASMFAGSLVSARLRNHRFLFRWPTLNGIFRKTLGGVLMGLGAILIPGGNDTLLMIGLPMGAWQAGLAYGLFIVTLAALIVGFGSKARSWSDGA